MNISEQTPLSAMNTMLQVNMGLLKQALTIQEDAAGALIEDMASLPAGNSDFLGTNIDYEA